MSCNSLTALYSSFRVQGRFNFFLLRIWSLIFCWTPSIQELFNPCLANFRPMSWSFMSPKMTSLINDCSGLLGSIFLIQFLMSHEKVSALEAFVSFFSPNLYILEQNGFPWNTRCRFWRSCTWRPGPGTSNWSGSWSSASVFAWTACCS